MKCSREWKAPTAAPGAASSPGRAVASGMPAGAPGLAEAAAVAASPRGGPLQTKHLMAPFLVSSLTSTRGEQVLTPFHREKDGGSENWPGIFRGRWPCETPLSVLSVQTDLLRDALSLSLSSYSCCPCYQQPPLPLATARAPPATTSPGYRPQPGLGSAQLCHPLAV